MRDNQMETPFKKRKKEKQESAGTFVSSHETRDDTIILNIENTKGLLLLFLLFFLFLLLLLLLLASSSSSFHVFSSTCFDSWEILQTRWHSVGWINRRFLIVIHTHSISFLFSPSTLNRFFVVHLIYVATMNLATITVTILMIMDHVSPLKMLRDPESMRSWLDGVANCSSNPPVGVSTKKS